MRMSGGWVVNVRLLFAGFVLLSVAGAQTPLKESLVVSPSADARAVWEVPRKTEAGHPGRAVWIASIAALAAANVADARTSWNKSEGNSILAGSNGSFGARGVAIKGGVNGLWVVGQVIVLRRNPRYRTLAIVNFAAASIFATLAYRNHEIGPRYGVR